MIVLDTSVLSMVLRRRPAARNTALADAFRALLMSHRMYLPGITMQEILSGIQDPAAYRALFGHLASFTPIMAEQADHVLAAEVVTRCRAAGVTASATDALIAAQAMRRSYVVLTTDPDFEHMQPHVLGLEVLKLQP